jgi:hypothetical protein
MIDNIDVDDDNNKDDNNDNNNGKANSKDDDKNDDINNGGDDDDDEGGDHDDINDVELATITFTKHHSTPSSGIISKKKDIFKHSRRNLAIILWHFWLSTSLVKKNSLLRKHKQKHIDVHLLTSIALKVNQMGKRAKYREMSCEF